MTKEMVESDLKENYQELILKECGFEVPKSYTFTRNPTFRTYFFI